MAMQSGLGGNRRSGTWDHTDCVGVEGCPPRCPRFVDDEGTPLLVRPGLDGAVESLVDFYDDYPSRDRSMSLPPLTRPQVESWVARIDERGQSMLAVDDGTVAGHVAYLPTEEGDPELIVFVGSQYQNRGLGTELCRQAMAHAAADGHDGLCLHVDENNERAIAVYRHLGFETVDTDGKRVKMRVELDAPRVENLQAPPAERL